MPHSIWVLEMQWRGKDTKKPCPSGIYNREKKMIHFLKNQVKYVVSQMIKPWLPCLQNGRVIIKQLFHWEVVRLHGITYMNMGLNSININYYHYLEIERVKPTLLVWVVTWGKSKKWFQPFRNCRGKGDATQSDEEKLNQQYCSRVLSFLMTKTKGKIFLTLGFIQPPKKSGESLTPPTII